MKAKLAQNIAIGLLVLCIFGVSVWIFLNTKQDGAEIPKSVQAKYVELGAMYEKYLGSSLMLCHSDKGKIFVVSGSSGFTGITYYYDLSGKALGSFEFSDMVFGDGPKPPVRVEHDSCKMLKENRPELQK